MDSANTYLPGSTKRVNLHIEVLMLFWKMMEANEKFASYSLETDKILTILSTLMYFMLEARNDSTQIGLARLCCFLLHTLSQERNFGVQLNTPFDHTAIGPVAKQLPVFSTGCWGDFLILAIYILITTTGSSSNKTSSAAAAMSSLHEHLLIAMSNVSPYIKSVSVVTANKLVSLFAAFSSPVFLLANESNHKRIFYLVEVFNNIIQYQITGNTHLVYAIVRHQQKLHTLHRMTFESAQAEVARLKAIKAERQKALALQSQSQQSATQPQSPTQSTADEGTARTSRNSSRRPSLEPSLNGSTTSLVGDDDASTPTTSTMTPTTATGVTKVGDEAGGEVPVRSTELSEKAKGKLPASATGSADLSGEGEGEVNGDAEKEKRPGLPPRAPSVSSTGGPPSPMFDARGKFVPTQEWFNYWKAHLPLAVMLTLVDALAPQIEQLCVDKALNDDRKVIEYLQSGTLVGLLPLPHPIFVRRFQHNDAVRIWFTSYLWGDVFIKSSTVNNAAETTRMYPPIWT
ncbi:cell wall biogenesis protein, partial [Quaeritorhiza haematococci]